MIYAQYRREQSVRSIEWVLGATAPRQLKASPETWTFRPAGRSSPKILSHALFLSGSQLYFSLLMLLTSSKFLKSEHMIGSKIDTAFRSLSMVTMSGINTRSFSIASRGSRRVLLPREDKDE